mgnify:CR=1 FL=1
MDIRCIWSLSFILSYTSNACSSTLASMNHKWKTVALEIFWNSYSKKMWWTGTWIDTFGTSRSAVFLNIYITCSVLGWNILSGTFATDSLHGCEPTQASYWLYFFINLLQARSLPVDKFRPTYYIINGLIYLLQVTTSSFDVTTALIHAFFFLTFDCSNQL